MHASDFRYVRCGGIINDDFVAYLQVNLSVKKFENRSTFGEVMDNIIVDCFFLNSQCTSGFVNDVMFAHKRPYGTWLIRHILKVTHQETVPG